MAPPFRPLVPNSAEGSGASNGVLISLHGFLTDMWGSHRGAAAHSIAARAADTLSASAEARLNQRFDKVLVLATVAVMVQLVVVFAVCLVLVSVSKRRRRAGIMRSATVV